MKNIFTALLGILITVTVFAAGIPGRVSVSFYGNNDYQAFIDGQSIYSDNNRVYLNNIRPGRHTIEVYRLKKNNKRENRPVSSSQFTFRPQYDLNIIIDRNGYTRFNETRADNDNKYDKNDKKGKRYKNDKDYGRNRDDDDDNGRWDRNGNNDDRYRDSNNRNDNNRRWSVNRGWNKDDNDNNNNTNYNKAISEADFKQVLQKINSQWFGKMNEARNAVQNNYFTASQIRQILKIFNSDSDRLELAKLAYGNVVDQGNYTQQVYELLSASSRNELTNYIRGK